MSAPTSIDDPDDPRVAEYRALNDAALRRAIEGAEVCIAEGSLVVERLLQTSFAVRSFLVSDRRWRSLGSLATGARSASSADLPGIASGDEPGRRVRHPSRGARVGHAAGGSFRRPTFSTPAVVVAVLEGINDHENMGVIFRNADALGIDAIVLDSTSCDPLYRRAIRVSMGAVFAVPFTRFADLDELEGFTLVALSPSGEHALDEIEADRVAILLGAEGPGLSHRTLAASNVRARIPMRPGVDSLGVASASAIAFHYFGRRHFGRHGGEWSVGSAAVLFRQYYLGCLSHASYLIGDTTTGRAVVVDPQRDVEQYVDDAAADGLQIERVIETHFHADFLSGHLELAAQGAVISFGDAAAGKVEYESEFLRDGDVLSLGDVTLTVLATPGHTPESISIVVRERATDAVPYAVSTGDTLFIGDVGRPDLLSAVGESAEDLARRLYRSLHHKLLVLPDATRGVSRARRRLRVREASLDGDRVDDRRAAPVELRPRADDRGRVRRRGAAGTGGRARCTSRSAPTATARLARCCTRRMRRRR